MRRGRCFGFGGLPRSATVTALEDTYVLRFDRGTAFQLVEASPQFATRVIQTLVDRLRTVTAVREPGIVSRLTSIVEPRRPLTVGQVLKAATRLA